MKILYYSLFFLSILLFGLFTTHLVNEIAYYFKKSKREGNTKLKNLAFKLLKRLLKVNAVIVWIAYETYVKGRRPNTYSIASWLLNIKIVEGREIHIAVIISVLFIIALVYTIQSRERLIKVISIEKRDILKNKVKSWDETLLSEEQKQQLYTKWYGKEMGEVRPA